MFLKDPITKLKLFNQKANELQAIGESFVMKKLTFNLSSHQETDFSQSLTGFTELELRAVMLSFRIFYLQQDSLFFLSICKLVKSLESVPDNIKELNEQWKKGWLQIQELHQKKYLINLNDEDIDSFDLWLYGHFFHIKDKDDKAYKIALLRSEDCEKLSYFYFADTLQKYSRCVMEYNIQVVSKIINLYSKH